MNDSSILLAFSIFIALLPIIIRRIRSRDKRNLPLGPPRLPLIGNAHQIPTEMPWVAFSSWAKKYGKYMAYNYLNMLTIMQVV